MRKPDAIQEKKVAGSRLPGRTAAERSVRRRRASGARPAGERGRSWCSGILVWGIALLTQAGLRSGEIRGTVRAEGKKAVQSEASGGKYDSRKFKFVERMDYGELKEFVVYVDQAPKEKPLPPVKALQVVTQKDATFHPHLLPVLVGTTVEWPNQDEILHNVFSFSETKAFDLGLYRDEIKKVTFDKPGRVDVFCSIHSKMHCIILVLEHPLFAATDTKGAFVMTNVPPGSYRLKAWHERLPPEVREVTVPEQGGVRVDFVLGIKGLPQY